MIKVTSVMRFIDQNAENVMLAQVHNDDLRPIHTGRQTQIIFNNFYRCYVTEKINPLHTYSWNSKGIAEYGLRKVYSVCRCECRGRKGTGFRAASTM
jgi:hypothetical protein